MNPESRAAMDAYLDAVDLALLKSNAPRSRRSGIVADLETHIVDALQERQESCEPTPADVAAVLATLGPPQAYANSMTQTGAPPIVRPRRTLPVHAKWAAALLPIGYLGVGILLVAFGGPNRGLHDPSDFILLMIASTPVVLMIALASCLGWAAFRAIQRDPRRHWGQPIAVLEVLGFPILLLLASPALFFAVILAGVLAVALQHLYCVRAAAREFLAGAG